jgi:glyoxylase-like metal-dependent hydrolase (beta-lactamase superfamily II)
MKCNTIPWRGRPVPVATAWLAAIAVTAVEAQQPDFSKVRIETIRVAEGVYMLVGSGGNIGVSVGGDGVAIIDDQFAPLVPRIRAAIATLTEQPVRFVINTHWHADHTGGNEAFGKAGSIIVAQGNVRRRMASDQVSQLSGRTTPASPHDALPVVTFDQSVTLHWNDDDLEVEHVPAAHTDGDAIIRFRRANVVHMGDIFFLNTYPFIDTGSGGSSAGVIAACDHVLGLIDDSTKVIPGHGPLATKADLQGYRDMLATVRERVAKMVKAGRSQEEVLAAAPTKDFDAKWGQGFFKPEQWVGRLYVELAREAASPSRR